MFEVCAQEQTLLETWARKAYVGVPLSFQPLECLPIVMQLGLEVFDPFLSLFLLGLDELFLGGFCIVVYGPREGRERSGYLAWMLI